MCGRITNCYLLQSDCIKPFSFPDIYLGGGGSWPIKAKENVKSGWEHTICYKCSSEKQPNGVTFIWELK